METWTGQDNLSLLIGADQTLSCWSEAGQLPRTDPTLETLTAQFGTLPDSPGRVASMRISLHNLAREEIIEHEPFDDADGIYPWVDRGELDEWCQRAKNLLDADLVPGDALINLALWQIIVGSYRDAESNIKKLGNLLGPHHSQVMMVRHKLAWTAISDCSKHKLAIRLGETLLDGQLRSQGPDHFESIGARRDLGYFYWAAGRTAEEIHHREIVVQHSEKVLGAQHPDTIMARSELSWSYWSVGRFTEAFVLRESVLGSFEMILGSDHPETISARFDLEHFRLSLPADS